MLDGVVGVLNDVIAGEGSRLLGAGLGVVLSSVQTEYGEDSVLGNTFK